MSVRLALHAHGGPGVGVGHLARCLALAEVAVDRGWRVGLAAPVDVPWLAAEFDALGAAVLPGDGRDAEVHVLDRYDEVAVPGSGLVVNIEDGVFGRRRADVVVDPNLAPSPRPPDGSGCVLAGPAYALLRARVRAARRDTVDGERVRHVAMTLGGSRLAEPVLHALVARLGATGLGLRCTVFGRFADAPEWVEVREPSPDLPARLVGADLVVSAAGVTLLEGCCLGVPLAIVCLADNQRAGYRRALELGLAAGLGEPDTLVEPARLAALLADTAGLARRARTARSVVDGHGAARVLDAVARRL